MGFDPKLWRLLSRIFPGTLIASSIFFSCGNPDKDKNQDVNSLAEKGFPRENDDSLLAYNQIPTGYYRLNSFSWTSRNAQSKRAFRIVYKLNPDNSVSGHCNILEPAQTYTSALNSSREINIPIQLNSLNKAVSALDTRGLMITANSTDNDSTCSAHLNFQANPFPSSHSITDIFTDASTKMSGAIYHLQPSDDPGEMKATIKNFSSRHSVVLYLHIQSGAEKTLFVTSYNLVKDASPTDVPPGGDF